MGYTSQMCGPTGVGFMHGTFEMMSSMEPFLGKDTVRCREFVQSV